MHRALAAACVLLVAACGAGPIEERGAAFDAWRARHMNDVAAYEAFLTQHGLHDVLPLAQLLRSGRRWQRCNADAFVLPHADAWPRIVPTLRLVRTLQREGLLESARASSVYRDAALNRCEGGAPQSRHLRYNAIDFDLARDADIARLCRFWREQGPRWRFGLGFYDARRIHVDTSGFRTWGLDHGARSSRCLRPT